MSTRHHTRVKDYFATYLIDEILDDDEDDSNDDEDDSNDDYDTLPAATPMPSDSLKLSSTNAKGKKCALDEDNEGDKGDVKDHNSQSHLSPIMVHSQDEFLYLSPFLSAILASLPALFRQYTHDCPVNSPNPANPDHETAHNLFFGQFMARWYLDDVKNQSFLVIMKKEFFAALAAEHGNGASHYYTSLITNNPTLADTLGQLQTSLNAT
ncbi:hypothetical protein JCM1840_002978 [Sporobolomyces johnsonii]